MKSLRLRKVQITFKLREHLAETGQFHQSVIYRQISSAGKDLLQYAGNHGLVAAPHQKSVKRVLVNSVLFT
ncbi:hypothetical protein SynRS9915_00481 [Synechococcus sp. RS9915]|nr:hypothetical protein SynRS9915_00481 [Synechococcus sp. RS9915]